MSDALPVVPGGSLSRARRRVVEGLRVLTACAAVALPGGAIETLEDRARWPTGSAAWMRAAGSTLHRDPGLHLVLLGPETAPRGFAALAPRRLAPKGTLDLATTEALNEPSDLVASDEAALADLARGLVRLGRPLHLSRVPADSPLLPALRAAVGRMGVVVARPRPGCPWLPLDASWAEPESHLNSGRRSDLRRARRRAEEVGPVATEIHVPTPQTLSEPLARALDVETRSWKGARQGAIAQDPIRGPFFRALAEEAAKAGTLHLALLTVGDRTVAMSIGLLWHRSLWLLKIAYEEEFARCSPGQLLTVETLRDAAVRGLATYEFLGAPDRWTEAWTPHVRPMAEVSVFPASLRGYGHLARWLAGAAWRRARSLADRGPPA